MFSFGAERVEFAPAGPRVEPNRWGHVALRGAHYALGRGGAQLEGQGALLRLHGSLNHFRQGER